jgi:hypothetical protein
MILQLKAGMHIQPGISCQQEMCFTTRTRQTHQTSKHGSGNMTNQRLTIISHY